MTEWQRRFSDPRFRNYFLNPHFWTRCINNPRKAWQNVCAALRYPSFYRISRSVEGLITLHLATELYEGVKRTQAISPNVVEVGAFKGLSTIFMSLGSYEVNKRVKSFEMFTGLPVCNPKLDSYWKIGEFASEQEEYELNVTRYGQREVVDLVVGDARETILPTLGVDGFSFAFLDVDVYEVMRDLLFKLWSIARGGEIIFVHDIHSPGIRQAVDELKQVAGRKVVEARPENVTARIHVVNR